MPTRKKIMLVDDEDKKKKYTKKDHKLFGYLSTDRRVTSIVVANKMYPDPDDIFKVNNVVSSYKNLARKLVINKEKFRIAMTPPRGPKANEYWLEKA